MWRYILRRIGLIFVTAFIILSLTYLLMKLLPMDKPLGRADVQLAYYENQVNLGYMVRVHYEKGSPRPASDVIVVNELDPSQPYLYNAVPVFQQYVSWIKNIFTKWHWGTSSVIEPGSPAMLVIRRRLPVSLKLNIWAMVVSVPLGFLFGIWAALKKNTLTDHIITIVTMVFISVPSFVIITFLMKWFGFDTNLLPTQWPTVLAPAWERFKGYIIPVACLSFGTIAGFTRMTRAELTEIMSSEFLLLARTKGLTKTQSVLRHALRNALVPLVPMIIGQFVGLLGGSMVLENLYGIPGIGSLFTEGITQKDYNLVMVVMSVYTMIGLFTTLIVDVSYGIVDPRIRMGARK